nr:pyridoxal phosphate-dependent aminotransferase [Alteromonas sp. C1M14]
MGPAIVNWHQRRHQRVYEKEIVSCHSVIGAVKVLIESLTQKGDGIALFSPVYGPLVDVVRACEREPVLIPLNLARDIQSLNPDGALDHVAMIIVCNPQNPTGQLWPAAIINALANMCDRLQIPLVCDEVHSAFVYPQEQFYSALQLPVALRHTAIVVQSATKAYNLAHIPAASYMVIPNTQWHHLIGHTVAQCHLYAAPVSEISLVAAYSPTNDRWLEDVNRCIHDNRKLMEQGLSHTSLMPYINNATFFCWLDLHLVYPQERDVAKRLFSDTGIAGNDGASFGCPGWVRLNIATQQQTVDGALQRLQRLWKRL